MNNLIKQIEQGKTVTISNITFDKNPASYSYMK